MIINDLITASDVSLVLKERNKAVFEIKPLSPGYGVTLGNALRRVLLSSLPGAAITKVKIENVPHEFTTIPGVLEDVLDIVLNLKQVRIKMEIEGPAELKLEVKGKGEVRAKDIQTPAGVEIVNKDLTLFTITSDETEVKMNLLVEKGRGYVPSELLSQERLLPGEIRLDANFSPIRNAVYEVENYRYLARTDYNLLRLTIETDGTMDPTEAFKEACRILINQFNSLLENLQ
jgi:DNA-directed RNA polymerase subunit alpha